ncbi:hypothetical protein Ancab_032487 [Ancistrocladus abbreviatus]
MPPLLLSSLKVAVIGGGAAGLVAARELCREGHKEVVVFERGFQVGGTWVYTPEVESDLLGLDPSRTIVRSSLYDSLRTNLPRQVMGFRDYPFTTTARPHRDSRRFPGHQEVLRYLDEFASEFGLNELVRFQTEVRHVGLEGDESGSEVVEKYDAVVVCNGHFTEPRIAEISGVEQWPGKEIHSHNYRTPEPYRDQVVILIGNSASAADISRGHRSCCKRSSHCIKVNAQWSMRQDSLVLIICGFIPMIASAHEDGMVAFQDGSKVLADVILHCTGYKYHFPFLHTNGVVTVDDNRVGPLYKHVFPPSLAPWLSFVGIPWKVVPFPLCEFQSKWIAGVLSGRIALPSQEKMMEDIEALYSTMEAAGIPKRYTHNLGDYQFEYNDWLAAECGCLPTEEWRKQMYSAAWRNRRAQPETYRDEWDDEELIPRAEEDFVKYLKGDRPRRKSNAGQESNPGATSIAGAFVR